MTFLIQQTLLYAVPLMIVALAGVFAERSGIINLALEGIMIFGAFIGVLFVRNMQSVQAIANAYANKQWLTLQGLELLAMLVAAALGVRCGSCFHVVWNQEREKAGLDQTMSEDTTASVKVAVEGLKRLIEADRRAGR